MLNIIVTLCTETLGFVHGISLRSALASESRPHFNTNLRLLTAVRGWSNPNSAIMCIDTKWQLAPSFETFQYVSLAGLPLLFLNVGLLLQVVIAILGLRAANILTWNSSPLDLTTALLYHTQMTPVPSRCMRAVSDFDVDGGPTKLSESALSMAYSP
ncbi:hypothetical protein F4604DRAFT_1957205 [Suillus subluteus]|nr:hypothetical protein F4604DRAFT_1957205 [Suillus subluteus]